MEKGSCLCGKIEYEVELIPEKTFNCHCVQCRKSHGAAFATQVFAKGSTLKFIKGEELIGEYQGELGIRAFCRHCGSRLMNYASDKNVYLSIALSTLDSDYSRGPVAHAFVAHKAAWHTPSTEIPAFDELPVGAIE